MGTMGKVMFAIMGRAAMKRSAAAGLERTLGAARAARLNWMGPNCGGQKERLAVRPEPPNCMRF